jgi:hypothetical protein
LHGPQGEYGAERRLWRKTEGAVREIVAAIGRKRPIRIVTIEKYLARSGLSSAEIEQQYADCDPVLTSRFHAGITAIRKGVPFIVIDQIKGGEKVFNLLAGLG